MIGLIDMDILGCRVFTPNPEIMLLSSYFKGKKEVVKLLGNFRDLQYYDKIFIRQNKKSRYAIPEELFNDPKIDFGGLFFTRGVYVKLPEEVLSCKPDPTIYDAFIKCREWKTDLEIRQKNSLNAQFLSIHNTSARTIDKNRVFIIDGDITDEDFSTLSSIQRRRENQVFHFYYPIHVKDSDKIKELVEYPWFPKKTPPKIICDSHIKEEHFPLIKKYFRNMAIIEYVPLQPKIHHWEIIPLAERVVNNAIHCALHEIPIQYHPNPQSRTGDKMNILSAAAQWSGIRTTKSFEEYCREDLPLNWYDITVDDFKSSPVFSYGKYDKIGGNLKYGW